MKDITPEFKVPSAEQELVIPPTFGDTPSQVVGGFMAAPGELRQGNIAIQGLQERILIGAATAPTTGTGVFIGNDGGTDYDFRAGNPSGNYIHWDGSAATLTIVGSITASAGTIGGFTIGATTITATNLTLDSSGQRISLGSSNDIIILDADDATYRLWIGHATAASAPFSVTKAGAVAASNITITGGSISSTPISSIPNSTATDISLLEATHDLVFSVTDKDTVAWASGTITLSNARTFSITGSNTGNMAARTYIYLDTGVSTTALQTTTTVATAMGANKKLIAVAQNGSAQAQFTVYGGIGGIKLPASGTSISNNNWTYSGTWSVTDADTVAWGSGTLTTSDGGSYSITGSNTGNMAAKTYIYFDLGTSSTAFQTTTTAATAIGDGKILIAIAQNGTGEANYIVVNDKQNNIDAANIVAGSITANELAAGSVTATKISVSNLAAINADMGTITAGSIGVNLLTAGTITSKAITLAISAGTGDVKIQAGKTDFGDTTSGFILGMDDSDSDKPKFEIGDSANYLTYDGTTLLATDITAVNAFTTSEAITAGNAVSIGDGVQFLNSNSATSSTTENTTTTIWLSQSFGTQAGVLTISQVFISFSNSGNTTSIKVSIRADSAGQPTGADLGSKVVSHVFSSSGLYGFTFDTPISVSPSTTYHVVLRVDSGVNTESVNRNNSASTGTNRSTDSGANWAANNGAIANEIYVVDSVAGQILKASAASSRARANSFIGFAYESKSASQSCRVLLGPNVSNQSGLTAGTTYYLSDTFGAIATSAGSLSRKVGIALTTTKLLVKHDNV